MSPVDRSPEGADEAADRGRLPKDFWRLWVSSASSNLGDGVRLIALPLVAAAIDPRPLVVATLSTLGYLPWLAFSLLAGGIADRVDRRLLMIRLQIFRIAVIGAFAVLVSAGQVSLLLLFVVAVLTGIAEVFFDSTAATAPPAVLPASRLERGNSRLYSAELTANEFVGSPLGAALFAWRSAAPFWFSLLGTAISALALSRIKGSFNPPPTRQVTGGTHDEGTGRDGLGRAIRAGIRLTLSSPFLRAWTIFLMVANLSRAMTVAVFVLYVLDILHGGSLAFGVLSAMVALGGLVGGWTADRVIARLGRRIATVVGVGAVVVSHLSLGLGTNAVIAGIAGVLFGTGIGLNNVLFVSMRQRIVPSDFLGRVASVQRFAAWGVLPLGALLGGWLAEATSLRVPYLTAAALVMIFFVALARPMLRFPTDPISLAVGPDTR